MGGALGGVYASGTIRPAVNTLHMYEDTLLLNDM